jgi:hypothetical protein
MRRRGGGATFYARTTLDGPEWTAPFTPSLGRGRTDWIVELTVDRDRHPVELVFRTAVPGDTGNVLTEVVKRLDLRDPANLAAAEPMLRRPKMPLGAGPRDKALAERVQRYGTTETSHYTIDDHTVGASGDLKAVLKLGLGVKRIDVKRTLIDATVQRGSLTGRRLDCVPSSG